jgi:hypothetical protein
MNLYVFEDVLTDYTSGMVLITAESLDEAQQIAYDEFKRNYREEDLESFLIRESGFAEPTASYLVGSEKVSGVRHVVYGGG